MITLKAAENLESTILYQNGAYDVRKAADKTRGFEVYKEGTTYATRCAQIGWQGQEGFTKAVQEADRRAEADKSTEHAELIQLGKYWLRDSPTSPAALAPTFLGAHTPLAFVCAHCIGRLRGRGCYVEKFATRNVFAPDSAPAPCALCS